MKTWLSLSFFAILLFSPIPFTHASDANPGNPPYQPFADVDQVVLSNQEITVDGKPLTYDVKAGSLRVHGKNDDDTADLSFIAYFATNSSSSENSRPISFCFNGGPGSSSVWLHMGLLGPKIVDLKSLPDQQLHPGYIDNPHSFLATSDLVFIDPVGTGFSHATGDTKNVAFYGVEEDLYPLADFIRLFLTKFERWNNPKFLIGESYGTLRAAGLTSLLQGTYLVDMDGIILISCVLDFSTLESLPLSLITKLPSYAATAQYHKKLHPPLATLPVQELVEQAASFSINEYAPALLLGDSISKEHRERIATRLSELTSLSPQFIAAHNLQISFDEFRSELLRSQGLTIGLYDGRMTAPALHNTFPCVGGISSSLDHSFYRIADPFATAFESYLTSELKWNLPEKYVFMNKSGGLWNFSVGGYPSPGTGYLSLLNDLRVAMLNNSKLRIFVAGGYYDLVSTYYSQCYSINQLFLPDSDKSRVAVKGYEGGHMMYLEMEQKKALIEDLTAFVKGQRK